MKTDDFITLFGKKYREVVRQKNSLTYMTNFNTFTCAQCQKIARKYFSIDSNTQMEYN